jgi:hypothetical protein
LPFSLAAASRHAPFLPRKTQLYITAHVLISIKLSSGSDLSGQADSGGVTRLENPSTETEMGTQGG